MADTFTYEIEHAGYDAGQSDKKGAITYSGFVDEFRAFPWIDEIERRRLLEKGAAPTLSVLNADNSTVYWVSMAGSKLEHTYLLGIIYQRPVKRLFGLVKAKPVRWLDIYLTQDKNIVEETFALFFENQYEKLMARLAMLEKYDDMEAAR